MSFLYDRLISHLDTTTRNPEVEKENQIKQAKLKELVQKNQTFISSQKKYLFNQSAKKITDRQELAYEDIQILKGIIDDFDKANKTLNNYDTLNTKSEELTAKYNGLSQITNGRLQMYSLINSIRQALRDCPDLPSEYIEKGKEAVTLTRNVLEQITPADFENARLEYNITVQEKFGEIMEKFNKGHRGGGKDEWDPKTGAAYKCYYATFPKISKNAGRLDFKELPTDPDPSAETLKNKEVAEALKADKEKDTFSIWNVFKTAFSTGLTIGIVLIVIFLALMGASISVNLNVYKPWPYRILCAIYGMVFSPVVILYRLLYRGWWLGKPPVYYGFLPMIPYFFVNKYTRLLLGWLTYRPDNHIWDLQEWRQKHTE